MKVFLFAVAICAVGISHALIRDLPEVAAAKAAHFEAVRLAEAVIANQKPSSAVETTQQQIGIAVQDTPEVAAAKATHFEAVREAELATAAANATNRHNPDVHIHHSSPVHHTTHEHISSFGHHTGASYYPTHVHHPVQHGHYTPPQHHHHVPDYHYYPYSTLSKLTTHHKLGINVEDTPEVALAKIDHYNAVRRAMQAVASPTVVVPALIPDTPEVAAARAHFEALRRAQVHQVQGFTYVPYAYNRQPIVAVPQTNQHKLGVNVQDTPEVAAAKAEHFAAFRRAELAAAEGEELNLTPHKNVYFNSARQYGQVQ